MPFGVEFRDRGWQCPHCFLQDIISLPSSSIVMTCARFLSYFLGLSLIGLTYWLFQHQLEQTEIDNPLFIYSGVLLFILFIFAITFGTIWVSVRGKQSYWLSAGGWLEVRRVCVLIATCLGVHFAIGLVQIGFGIDDDRTFVVTAFLVWTAIPAAFLYIGIVRLPQRLRSPPLHKLLLVGAPVLILTGAMGYNNFTHTEPPWAPIIVMFTVVLVAAAYEEFVFRMLLLTALLGTSLSRFQSIFLSAILFAAVHAPLTLAQPILWGDWLWLYGALIEYAPKFLMQTVVGLILGVAWVRTGSFLLVVIAHSAVNWGVAFGGAVFVQP